MGVKDLVPPPPSPESSEVPMHFSISLRVLITRAEEPLVGCPVAHPVASWLAMPEQFGLEPHTLTL